MRKTALAIVGLILVFVFLTRWMGTHEGLPYLYHWDEVITSTSALNILKTGDLRPKNIENAYGGFLRYSSLVLDTAYYFYLKWTGDLVSVTDIRTNLEGEFRTISHPQFYLLNRFLCVLLSIGCIWLSYRIVRLMEPEHYIGAIATVLFLSTSSYHFEESRVTLPNVPMAFWAMFTLLFSLKYCQTGKISHLILALIGSGTAAGTKLSGAFTLSMPLLAFLSHLSDYRHYPLGKKILGVFVLGITPILSFLLWTPSILIDLDEWLRWTIWQIQEYSDPNVGQFKKEPGWEHFLFQMSLIWNELGPLLFSGSVLGAFLILLRSPKNRERRSKIDIFPALLLVGIPVCYILYFTQQYIAYHRNFMVVYPFLAVWFGLFVQRCADGLELLLRKALRRASTGLPEVHVAFLLILTAAYFGLYYARYHELMDRARRYYYSIDTRTQAVRTVNNLIDTRYKGAGIVGIASELKMSPVDLNQLDVPSLLFHHEKIGDAYHHSTILLVGKYRSISTRLHSEDDRLNKKTETFNLLAKVDGNTTFRDTSPPESQTPHINPEVYILEGTSIEEASLYPLPVAQSFDEVAMYFSSEHELFSLDLRAGHYELLMAADGTPVRNEFPKVEIMVGDTVIQSLILTAETTAYPIRFTFSRDGRTSIKVRFVNDSANEHEDRNVFIRSVELLRTNESVEPFLDR